MYLALCPKAKHLGIKARSAAKCLSIHFSLTALIRLNIAETSMRSSIIIFACVPSADVNKKNICGSTITRLML